ncbi:DUF5372 family protein [Rhizobium beringeri]
MARTMAFRVSTSSGSCRSGGVMRPTRAYFAPVFLPFQAVDSLRRRHLPNNLRRLHRHRADPFPVHAVNERHKLSMIELHPVVADPRPAELRLLLAACTSHRNAASTNADTQLVRVTHPFHPLFPRQLPCVGKRYNRHGERLLLQTEDATVWSVPPQWTDLVSPDPEVAMSNGRSLLRVADLMELTALVERLSSKSGTRRRARM